MHNVATTQFSAEKWQQKILKAPREIETLLLECCRNPQMCSILKDFYSLGLWGEMLLTHPSLEKYCNESLLLELNPVDYLYSHPAEISGDSLKRLTPAQFAGLLTLRPEVWKIVDKRALNSNTWLEILKEHPEYVGSCKLRNLTDMDYGTLIQMHPEWHQPECQDKMARLPSDFWAGSWLFAHPKFCQERHWRDFSPKQWKLVFTQLVPQSAAIAKDISPLASLMELASLRGRKVGEWDYHNDYSKDALKQSLLNSVKKPTQFRKKLNGCLSSFNFKALEYLMQLNREAVPSLFNYFGKTLVLCVYAPYLLVCQMLPKIDPDYVCATDLCGNTALHYTFLRDPIGDDPETNSIRNLLRTMGVKDTANDDGFKLADLFRFLQRQVKGPGNER